MGIFCCPVCGGPLDWEEKRAVCEKGHSFDRAREGYVNLLQSQASSRKRHGDDRLMLNARQAFLSKGHYGFLLEAVAGMVLERLPEGGALLDVGCGEGYYTEGVYRALAAAGRAARIAAADISRDAVKRVAKRPFPKEAAVASAFSLPAAAGSCDALVSIFAPAAPAEFARVLRPGGILFRAVPGEKHLLGLKRQIYDRPYENPPARRALEGFAPEAAVRLARPLRLEDPADIQALFQMTPYYYKTSAADQAKAASLPHLETELDFMVLVDKVVKTE